MMKKQITIFLFALCAHLCIAQTPCLTDNFDAGYGNWTGSGTYTNSTAGASGLGVGFNSTNDALTTSALITDPASISFDVKRTTSSGSKTFEIQYSSDGASWTSAASFSNADITTGSHENKTVSLNLTGDYYIRFILSQRSGGSIYLDNAEVSCGATACPANMTLVSVVCESETSGSDNYTATLTFNRGSSTSTFSISSTLGNVSPSSVSTDGDITITVSGILESNAITVTAGDGVDCSVEVSVDSPECRAISHGGELTFQMINPCGNNGDNEFVVFTSGDADLSIDDIALGSVSDDSDASWNYFWSTSVENGEGPAMTENGNSVTTSAENDYGIFDPVNDASTYTAVETELNLITESTPAFITPSSTDGTIPPNSTVIFFIGYGTDGFDDAATNLDFNPQVYNGPFYFILGKGTASGGYFSNSNPRTQYMTIGAEQTNISYDPNNPTVLNGGGGGEYLSPDGTYYEDSQCIPQSSLVQSEPTPVSYSEFLGRSEGGHNILSWTTASEIENAYFMVQRSLDGNSFEDIGKVDGHGTTNVKHQYTFADIFPNHGVNYYRLVQYDLDQSNRTSKTISIHQRSLDSSIISASSENIILDISTEGNGILTIYDLFGRTMAKQGFDCNNQKVTLPLPANITRGIYAIEIQINGTRITEKLSIR